MTDTPSETDRLGILRLTADIVAAHASNNALSPDALTQMIQDVFRTLSDISRAGSREGSQNEAARLPAGKKPAVPVNKSVFPGHIVCLEDGKKLKMLKRHLKAAYGLTPAEYRARWGLPADYPMVAPDYARRRSSLAKKMGLGHGPKRARG